MDDARTVRLRDDSDDDETEAPPGTPVIFLDIHDVLCLSDPFGGHFAVRAITHKHSRTNQVYRHLFHPPAVAALRAVHVQMEGRVRYVISTTWRLHMNRNHMGEVMRLGGLDFVAGSLEQKSRWRTVSWPNQSRLQEVIAWLKRHGTGRPFVVIDDSCSGASLVTASNARSGPFAGRVVLCQQEVGLLPEHVEKVVAALGRQFEGWPEGA